MLPASVRAELGSGHLCFFVRVVVERLDMSVFEHSYSDEGGELYAPQLMRASPPHRPHLRPTDPRCPNRTEVGRLPIATRRCRQLTLRRLAERRQCPARLSGAGSAASALAGSERGAATSSWRSPIDLDLCLSRSSRKVVTQPARVALASKASSTCR